MRSANALLSNVVSNEVKVSISHVMRGQVNWVYLESVHGGDKIIGSFCGRFQVGKCLLIVRDSYDSVSN